RDKRLVPVCIAHPATKTPQCTLVGDKTELPIGAACPAWVDGNAASSYYTVHWQDRPATQWLARLSPNARVIVGDDVAATFRRGELSAKDALGELRTLFAGDLDTQIAGIALAKEIDAIVDDATRPAWSRWLAPRLPKLKRGKNPQQVYQLARELGPMLVTADRLAAGERVKARELVDDELLGDRFPDPPMLGALTTGDARSLFDRLVDKALSAREPDRQEHWLGLLGAFPPDFAERTATLLVDKAELPVDPIWSALEEYFERPSARIAAWKALRDHLDVLMKRAAHHGADMIGAAAWLCDQSSRDEVAKAFVPFLDRIPAGKTRLDRSLATIDQCIARRGRIGDLAAAIATSR
ncbi:MAG TPA: hypothetical protein VFV99_25030, partial [Kofleriaceae bacterium]|nr:hypothetical protein [Kofleriaceae bacterium]